MSIFPEEGELLVGACLRVNHGCDFVVYNHPFPERGSMGEVDVVGLDFENRRLYLCEAATHLGGLNYGVSRPETVQRIEKKLRSNAAYAETVASDWEPVLQFWAPTTGPSLVEELAGLAKRLQAEGLTFELVTNEAYAEAVATLTNAARGETKQRGEAAYRFLQILTHLKTDTVGAEGGAAARTAPRGQSPRVTPARGGDALHHVVAGLRAMGYTEVRGSGRIVTATGPEGDAFRAAVRQSSYSTKRDNWSFTFHQEADDLDPQDPASHLIGVRRSRLDPQAFEATVLWMTAREGVAEFEHTARWHRGEHRLDFVIADREGTRWYSNLRTFGGASAS